VLAAADYPSAGDVGAAIDGVAEAEAGGALVFHAGTARRGDRLVTNGGRILNVTGIGEDLVEARTAAYAAVEHIAFPGMKYRSDIAARAESRVT
jgi:phosphoribosylamine--glycine ligase